MRNIEVSKKLYDGNRIVIIEALLCLIIVYASVLNRHTYASLAFTISFLVLFCFFVVFVVKAKLDEITSLLVFIIIISFSNSITSLIAAGIKITFPVLRPYISFVCTLIFFCIAVYHKINEKTEKYFYRFQMFIAIAYPFCYFFVPMQVNHTYATSFNFMNPNLAGLFILQSILYMLLGAIRYKEISIKIVFGALAVINFLMILKTDSRNVLLSLAMFLILIAWSYIKQKYKFNNVVIFLFSAAPIIFVPVYMIYINVIIQKGWFSFLTSEGKNLDSRIGVWQTFFGRLGGKWFTGNYAVAGGNAHNSQMVVLCSFGLIVLILVIAFTYKIIQKINNSCDTYYDACCISAFFAVLFMGLGEGALFSGAIGIYILAGSFLFLISVEKDADKHQDKVQNYSFFET